ncbi:NAD(P)H-hydrate dehydratase [Pelagibius sp. Alg239-R121]|uniref:NAD(P)H-hydrate dehydratase n=1 Tax=Pelagibius sp. Alg239-R121 TaxID=2993448 RepID=UPI002AC32801|nr:NAD(P)H-hydrate dehydratase [Pelagibius sp. Alg239-R121]
MQERHSELINVSQMYKADAAAVTAGVSGTTLMENAGQAIFDAIVARWTPRPLLVLCGPGNNGGDGFVVARLLKAAGWNVDLALLGEASRLTGDAAHHAKLWTGEVLAFDPVVIEDKALIVDALFGAGLSRPLDGRAAMMVRAVNRAVGQGSSKVIAVDVPSGISGDSGAVLGDLCLTAELTVSFFRPKVGHLLLPGRDAAGELVVADIGIPDAVLDSLKIACHRNDPAIWRDSFPRRSSSSHKYTAGHALVLGGSEMTGAARLGARAALRIGAGLVSIAAASTALQIYALSSASVITLACDSVDELENLLRDPRKNAVLIGPGYGTNELLRELVLAILRRDRATVLDADALSIFGADPQSLFNALGSNVVLTPHDGEFRHLFPDMTGDRLSRARSAAARSGAIVVLKGSDTVISEPGGRAVINDNAPPYLATAGSGDVLAGLILGLLAQGMPPFDAAAAAVWMHGELGRSLGAGLISEDLPERLPQVLSSLLKSFS